MKDFVKDIRKHKLSEYSAQSAYYIILSIIPFTLVFISLIQYINIDKETLMYFAKQIIPMGFQEFSLNVIEEIYSKTITTLSISIIFTIWSASKGVFSIIKGINKIYDIKEKNYFYDKIKAFAFTILFIFILALSLLILVFGNYIGNFLLMLFKTSSAIRVIEKVISIKEFGVSFIMFHIFLLFYKIINNCQIKKHTLGALFATLVWFVLSYGFSIYIDFYKGFSILYGSLTTIILFMIWTYCLIYTVLIGAEINAHFK